MAKPNRKRLLAQRQKNLTSRIEVSLWRKETELLKALAIQRNGHPNLESYIRNIVVDYISGSSDQQMSFYRYLAPASKEQQKLV